MEIMLRKVQAKNSVMIGQVNLIYISIEKACGI
jgi:hypothetical protein